MSFIKFRCYCQLLPKIRCKTIEKHHNLNILVDNYGKIINLKVRKRFIFFNRLNHLNFFFIWENFICFRKPVDLVWIHSCINACGDKELKKSELWDGNWTHKLPCIKGMLFADLFYASLFSLSTSIGPLEHSYCLCVKFPFIVTFIVIVVVGHCSCYCSKFYVQIVFKWLWFDLLFFQFTGHDKRKLCYVSFDGYIYLVGIPSASMLLFNMVALLRTVISIWRVQQVNKSIINESNKKLYLTNPNYLQPP